MIGWEILTVLYRQENPQICGSSFVCRSEDLWLSSAVLCLWSEITIQGPQICGSEPQICVPITRKLRPTFVRVQRSVDHFSKVNHRSLVLPLSVPLVFGSPSLGSSDLWFSLSRFLCSVGFSRRSVVRLPESDLARFRSSVPRIRSRTRYHWAKAASEWRSCFKCIDRSGAVQWTTDLWNFWKVLKHFEKLCKLWFVFEIFEIFENVWKF